MKMRVQKLTRNQHLARKTIKTAAKTIKTAAQQKTRKMKQRKHVMQSRKLIDSQKTGTPRRDHLEHNKSKDNLEPTTSDSLKPTLSLSEQITPPSLKTSFLLTNTNRTKLSLGNPILLTTILTHIFGL